MREFDTDLIRIITTFENITGTEVRDCVKSNSIYFLVNTGKAAIAIGRQGQMIKAAERILQKPIKIYEYSENTTDFVKNLIPQAKRISINNDRAIITISDKDRGIVIGKLGNNIKVLSIILERNSALKELKVV